MPITERILQVIEIKGLTKYKFCQDLGLSKGFLDKPREITTDKYANILVYFPDINPEWLLTGNGSMLKESKAIDKNYTLLETIKTGIVTDQEVPLYDIEAAANLKTIFTDKTQNIIDKIRIPQLPKCDGAVYVRGDSMYPLLKSGDIVIFKQINEPQCLIYGEMYLVDFSIAGDDYLVVKYIQRSDISDHVRLISYNEHHQPIDIPASAIRSLAIIKATVRLNTII